MCFSLVVKNPVGLLLLVYMPVVYFMTLVLVFSQHYPDYYAIIKEPIDLRTIAQRIQVINYLLVCCPSFSLTFRFQNLF